MEDYIIEHLYPTPIYATILDEVDAVQAELAAKIDQVNYITIDSWGRPHHISTALFDEDIMKRIGLEELPKRLDWHLRNYMSEVGFAMRDYRIESWFSKFEPGEHGQVHNHHIADVSGVYYYKTNEKDGDLFFESPVPCNHSSLCFGEKYGQRWRHSPKVGKLLLFPGWLNHGITTNHTDEDRISVSFNIHFKRLQ